MMWRNTTTQAKFWHHQPRSHDFGGGPRVCSPVATGRLFTPSSPKLEQTQSPPSRMENFLVTVLYVCVSLI